MLNEHYMANVVCVSARTCMWANDDAHWDGPGAMALVSERKNRPGAAASSQPVQQVHPPWLLLIESMPAWGAWMPQLWR